MPKKGLVGSLAAAVLISSIVLIGAKKYTAPLETLQAPDDCEFCHYENVERAKTYPSHGSGCFMCHRRARTGFGAGHMTRENCEACHNETWPTGPKQGHPQDVWKNLDTPQERTDNCAMCHDSHGTPNLYMIRDRLWTFTGTPVEISFKNENGQADDSFVELSQAQGGTNGKEPGEGLCEVCHTQTNHYRRDGTGLEHFTMNCVLCHDHSKGFVPPEM